MAQHPLPEKLLQILNSPIDLEEWQAIDQHLAECPACCEKLDHLSQHGAIEALGTSVVGRIGRYSLLEPIAAGGMGRVFKALPIGQTNGDAQDIVALKMIGATRVDDPEICTRFRQEIETLRRVEHPHVVRIYDWDDEHDPPYFTMEFLPATLRERIAMSVMRGKPLPVVEVSAWIEKLARGVHAMHEAGVLHRDIKPTNVLFGSDGEPRIADFGIVKLLDATGAITTTGAALGTIAYVAPEQLSDRSDHLTRATDVHALGVLLYESLTGRPPFCGEDSKQIAIRILNDDVQPLHLARPDVPRSLEWICQKCLEKDPAKRYPTAAELADDLHRLIAGEKVRARPIRRARQMYKAARKHPRLTFAALTAIVSLLVAAIFVWNLDRAYRIGEIRRVEAETARTAEQDALKRANASAADANQAAAEAQDRLVRMNVMDGVRLLDDGEHLRALPRLYNAMELDDPAYRAIHLLRLGAVFSIAPVLHKAHVLGSPIRFLRANEHGTHVVAACDDGNVAVWNITTDETVKLRHIGAVRSLDVNSDASLIATVDPMGMGRVWDTRSGKLIAMLRSDRGARYIALNPDGQTVATADADRRVRLWKTSERQPFATTEEHPDDLTLVKFSLLGDRLLTGCGGVRSYENGRPVGEARVWNTADGTPLTGPLQHSDDVTAGTFSLSGELVATGGWHGDVKVWDVRSGQQLGRTCQHQGDILSISFSRDSQHVLSASGGDQTAVLWNFVSGSAAAGPLHHEGPVYHAALTPDETHIVTTSFDGAVRLWDRHTSQLARSALPHPTSVEAFAVLDGGRIATGDVYGVLRIWDFALDPIREVEMAHGSCVQEFAISPDAALVAAVTGSENPTDKHTARVYDLKSGIAVTPDLRHSGHVTWAAFSPSGKLIATACVNGSVRLWNVKSGEQVGPPLEHNGPIRKVLFGKEDQGIITCSYAGDCKIWHLGAETNRSTLLKSTGSVGDMALTPNCRHLLTGGANGTLSVYSFATGQKIDSAGGHEKPVRVVCCSPQGDLVATGAEDGSIAIWQIDQGHLRLKCRARHGEAILAMKFHPKGHVLAAGSVDRSARLWNVHDGTPATPALQHDDIVRDVDFSPDGLVLVTASGGPRRGNVGEARLWDTRTGEPASPWIRHPNDVYRARFLDTTRLCTSCWDGTLRVLRLPRQLPEDRLRAACNAYSAARVDETGGYVNLSATEYQEALRQYDPSSWPLQTSGFADLAIDDLAAELNDEQLRITFSIRNLGTRIASLRRVGFKLYLADGLLPMPAANARPFVTSFLFGSHLASATRKYFELSPDEEVQVECIARLPAQPGEFSCLQVELFDRKWLDGERNPANNKASVVIAGSEL